jgi:hypothetical protein
MAPQVICTFQEKVLLAFIYAIVYKHILVLWGLPRFSSQLSAGVLLPLHERVLRPAVATLAWTSGLPSRSGIR